MPEAVKRKVLLAPLAILSIRRKVYKWRCLIEADKQSIWYLLVVVMEHIK